MTDQQEPPDGSGYQSPYSDLEDLTGAEPLPVLEDPGAAPPPPPRSPLLTGLIVGLLLVVGSIAIFQFLSNDDGDDAATETTTTTSDEATTTTSAGDGADTPTTTQGVTDTTTGEAIAEFEPYTAAGDPVPVADLALAVDAVGPIELGTPAADAIGRLIASLGDPDADDGPMISTGAFGTCQGDVERLVRWGPFIAIVIVAEDGTETFVGYRLDFSYGDLNSPATDLATLSGVRAGDPVLRLEQVYEAFDLRYEVMADLGNTFQLYSRNSGELLLWGPVTSSESNGIVLGIYAPDACGAGDAPDA